MSTFTFDTWEHLQQILINFSLSEVWMWDFYWGFCCFYVSDLNILTPWFHVMFLFIFPLSWWQNAQKLQINFSPAEPEFNEVSQRLHREASPTDEPRRTTRGVLFSPPLLSSVWKFGSFANSCIVTLKLRWLTYWTLFCVPVLEPLVDGWFLFSGRHLPDLYRSCL